MGNKVKSKHDGFSLIELMIVVAIVAIIAVIAYPSYLDYITRANRTQGQSILLDAQLKQERYRSYNNTYAANAASLAERDLPLATDDNYTFTTSGSSATDTFTVTATATGVQAANDSDCTPMTIDQSNNLTPPGCWAD